MKDLAKFRDEAKIKAADVDLYKFVREHVRIEPDEKNVRLCFLCVVLLEGAKLTDRSRVVVVRREQRRNEARRLAFLREGGGGVEGHQQTPNRHAHVEVPVSHQVARSHGFSPLDAVILLHSPPGCPRAALGSLERCLQVLLHVSLDNRLELVHVLLVEGCLGSVERGQGEHSNWQTYDVRRHSHTAGRQAGTKAGTKAGRRTDKKKRR